MIRSIVKLLLTLNRKDVRNREMSTIRYFLNTKPDYQPEIGPPEIQETKILTSLNQIISKIEYYVKPIDKNGGDGLYLGCAGISYMYYHLSQLKPLKEYQDVYIEKALNYLKPALFVASYSTNRKEDIPSFILGNCGVYALASVLYKTIGDEEQSNHFRNLYLKAASTCMEQDFLTCGSDELFVGRAGYILGALWMAEKTGTPIVKEDLHELCAIMIKSGHEYSSSHFRPCPLMYSYYQVEYLGTAHGLCAILQVLLMVPDYLEKNPSDSIDIKSSIDYLLSTQTQDGNFPAAVDEIGHNCDLVHWCHGAGGTAYLMAKSYLVFKEQKYLDSCEKIAELIWSRGLLKKGPGLCHGVAGNAYVFLLLYRLTSDPKYLHRAHKFYEFMESEEFRKNARVPDFPYSLFEGLAGTACFLGDLTAPDQACFPFFNVFN